MSDADRQSILARRALFVASALGSLTGAARAQPSDPADPAYELPAMACPVPLDDVDSDRRLALYTELSQALAQGDTARAEALARKGLELSQHPLFLFQLAKLERESQRFEEALQHFRALATCEDEGLQKNQQEIDEAIEFLKRLPVIVVECPDAISVRVDEGRAKTNDDSEQRRVFFRVSPGVHRVRVESREAGGGDEVITVTAGPERVELVRLPHAFAVPCLTLLPCLEPPPPPPPFEEDAWRARLELGVLPFVPIGTGLGEEIGPLGAGARLGLDYGLSESTSLSFGLAPWVLDGVDGVLLPLGAFFDFNLHFGSAWVGLGLTSGYELGAEGRIPEETTPQNGFFVSPELTFFGFQVGEHWSIASRVQTVLAPRRSDSESDFGVTHVGVGIWVGYRFGQSEEEVLYASSGSRGAFAF